MNYTNVRKHSRKVKKGYTNVKAHQRKLSQKVPHDSKHDSNYIINRRPRVSDVSGNNDYAFFHTIKKHDLDKIYELNEGNDLRNSVIVAPSVGITKRDDVLSKFGEIIFIGDKNTIIDNEMTVFERDFWSPTLEGVPQHDYYFDPSPELDLLIDEYPDIHIVVDAIEHFFNKCRKDSLDPMTEVENQLSNDYGIYSIYENSRYLKSKYEDSSDFFEEIVKYSIMKEAHSPESISEYLKEEFGEPDNWRGQDAFAQGYAHASKQVPYHKLDEVANDILATSEIDFREARDMQGNLAQKVSSSFNNEWNYGESLALSGELARIYDDNPSDDKILSVIRKHGVKPNRFFQNFPTKSEFRKYHKDIYKWYREIPSEYMEAKTLDPVSINDFPKVLVPKKDKKTISLLKEMNYKGKIILYKR